MTEAMVPPITTIHATMRRIVARVLKAPKRSSSSCLPGVAVGGVVILPSKPGISEAETNACPVCAPPQGRLGLRGLGDVRASAVGARDRTGRWPIAPRGRFIAGSKAEWPAIARCDAVTLVIGRDGSTRALSSGSIEPDCPGAAAVIPGRRKASGELGDIPSSNCRETLRPMLRLSGADGSVADPPRPELDIPTRGLGP